MSEKVLEKLADGFELRTARTKTGTKLFVLRGYIQGTEIEQWFPFQSWAHKAWQRLTGRKKLV